GRRAPAHPLRAVDGHGQVVPLGGQFGEPALERGPFRGSGGVGAHGLVVRLRHAEQGIHEGLPRRRWRGSLHGRTVFSPARVRCFLVGAADLQESRVDVWRPGRAVFVAGSALVLLFLTLFSAYGHVPDAAVAALVLPGVLTPTLIAGAAVGVLAVGR